METIRMIMNLVKTNDNEKGVTTVEYAVMLVMVALAVIALGTGIGSAVTGVFNNIKAQL